MGPVVSLPPAPRNVALSCLMYVILASSPATVIDELPICSAVTTSIVRIDLKLSRNKIA